MTFFDRFGIFRGRCNQDSSIRDEHGVYHGRVDHSDYYDVDDVYGGHVEDGSLYDGDGCFVGTIDDSGDVYSASGVYLGHWED